MSDAPAGIDPRGPRFVAAITSVLLLVTVILGLTGLPTARYVEELFARVRTIGLTRRIADALSELRRLEHSETPDHDRSRELGIELQGLQRELAAIKEGMS